MTIYQLEAFTILAELLNYTRASQILHTTQPNLSKIISNLEEEAGIQLFMRNKRDVRLTPAGLSYYRDIKNMLALHEKALEKARHVDEGIEGVIHIGFLGTALTGYLPRIVNKFRRAHPKIMLKLEDYTFSPLNEALRGEEIDAALTLDRELENIPRLEKKFLFSDDMCMVMHKDHPMANEKKVSLDDIREEPFVMMDPKVSMLDFELVSDICARHGFFPKVAHEANTLQNVMMMVECKVGVSILAGHMRRFATDYLRFVEIEGFESFFKVICAWRRGLNPSMLKLLEIIDSCHRKR